MLTVNPSSQLENERMEYAFQALGMNKEQIEQDSDESGCLYKSRHELFCQGRGKACRFLEGRASEY